MRTAVAFFFAALSPPIMLWTFERAGMTDPHHDVYIMLVVGGLSTWALSIFATRIVHQLGVSVDAAHDLGSYHLDERIGQGGMGEVWRARHKMLARPAAIKVIRPEALRARGTDTDELVARFEKEAQATAALSSSHTVRLYDYGTAQDGAFYYVMELLRGIDLQRLVQRFGPVPPERAIYLLKQVCHSLREAHALGLVHRDIKPSNLFLCRHGVDHDFVKVLDFGLVKQVQQKAQAIEVTGGNIIPGTPAYMAPEELTAERPIDGRTDLYSVGCVAYWLLTGHLVFEGDKPMTIAIKHVSEAPRAPSERTTQPIPPALDALVLELLAKDPDRRPSTANELEARLERIPVARPWTEERAAVWWNEHELPDVDEP
jgi:serine/threonine-protein kinase